MARDDKNYMPQSGAGLMRFNEDDKSVLQIKPEHVIAISSIVGAGLLVLRFLA